MTEVLSEISSENFSDFFSEKMDEKLEEKLEEEIRQISKIAFMQLEHMKPQSNSAVVFDIDDTLLYSKNRQPIQPIVNLYQYVLSRGFTPVIITARIGDEYGIRYTVDELKKIGVDNYKLMYFRKDDTRDPAKYKLNCRKVVHKLGYTIVMSIGDMDWDIGEYAGIGILLPREEILRKF